MPFVTLPFAEWMPDQFPLGSPGAATITNVVPLTATTYGPVPATAAYSGALTDRIIGSYTLKDAAGNSYVFAGTRAALYLLKAGSANFGDVSGAVYAGDPWPDTQWAFTSFGLRVIACNFIDNTQTFLVGTDAVFSDLSADAPRAKYAAAVGDFVMLAHTFDGVSGNQSQRVWWSAIGDPTSWPTPGTLAAIQVQSDYQDLQQTDLGQITGIIAGPLPTASVTIFCEHGIYVGLYVGSPSIFSFKAIDGAPGCTSPQSIAKGWINSGGTLVPVVFYKSSDGFYAFNGTSSAGIGANKVNNFVLDQLDTKLSKTVLSVSRPDKKLIYWYYSSKFASGGNYDRAVVFNWDVNRWSYIDSSSSQIEWATQTSTIGYTLDELDQFGALDTLPYSLDSEVWAGGDVRMGVFNSSHQLAYATGANLSPTVETVELEPVPGRRVFIRNIRPLVDAFGGSVAIGVRERQANTVIFNRPVLMNPWGECPQRCTGRYVRAQLTFPAGVNFTHLSGVEADVIQTGIRGPGPWLLAEDGVTVINDESGNPMMAG